MKQINYLEYQHSYAHTLEPKMKQLNIIVNVAKKPVNYVKAVIKNVLNQSKDLRWTDKEQFFFDNIMAQETSRDIYYYCKNAINKAKEIEVWVDDNGELFA